MNKRGMAPAVLLCTPFVRKPSPMAGAIAAGQCHTGAGRIRALLYGVPPARSGTRRAQPASASWWHRADSLRDLLSAAKKNGRQYGRPFGNIGLH